MEFFLCVCVFSLYSFVVFCVFTCVRGQSGICLSEVEEEYSLTDFLYLIHLCETFLVWLFFSLLGFSSVWEIFSWFDLSVECYFLLNERANWDLWNCGKQTNSLRDDKLIVSKIKLIKKLCVRGQTWKQCWRENRKRRRASPGEGWVLLWGGKQGRGDFHMMWMATLIQKARSKGKQMHHRKGREISGNDEMIVTNKNKQPRANHKVEQEMMCPCIGSAFPWSHCIF